MLINNMKINGIVVLYNPDKSVINNISSYAYLLEKLFVIDNSESNNYQIIKEINKNNNTEYIGLGENKGIAYAFNLAAKKSIAEGVNWLLTMDQDSSFKDNSFEKFIEDFENVDKNNLAIFAAFHGIYRYDYEVKKGIIEANRVISSGNLIDLDAYSVIGGFDDKLFIDFVDHDYCFKSRKCGYKILVDYNVTLNHKLGDIININFWGKKRLVMNHSPLRKYYMTRNRLEIVRRYLLVFPKESVKILYMFFYETLFMLFVERKRATKIKMIIMGFYDFFRRSFGKNEKFKEFS